ncbi:RNA polymerase sigma factor [Planctomycetota bacterium]
MLRYIDGDEGAFDKLYCRFEKPILSFIYRIVSNTTEAEDLCQETFLKVVQAKRRYKANGIFKTWLFRIALNLCRDKLRRTKVHSKASLNAAKFSQSCDTADIPEATISDASSDPVRHSEIDEMSRLVQQAFAKLTEEQRTVVILREYHSLQFAEVAEIMNSPVSTVKSLNYRGHEKLLKLLSKHID